MTDIDIRPATAADLGGLAQVATQTELFPPEMLPELLADPEAVWLLAQDDGGAVGLCYAAPEPLTDGTWNMRALGVLPGAQGRGVGARLVAEMERALAAAGHRILLVDTSGTEAFARARRFYAARGYTPEARIRDYWAAGDDKETFRKALR